MVLEGEGVDAGVPDVVVVGVFGLPSREVTAFGVVRGFEVALPCESAVPEFFFFFVIS